jgi:hypothetical protein
MMHSPAQDQAFTRAVHEQWQRSRVFHRIPRVDHTTPARDYRVHITLFDLDSTEGTVERFQVRYSPN